MTTALPTQPTDPQASALPAAVLLDVNAVAALMAVSPRTVRLLTDAGRMPAPIRLRGLVRWNRGTIDAWIAGGCPDCRKAGRP